MTDELRYLRGLIGEAMRFQFAELTCKVVINGEEIVVRQVVDTSVYARPEMRAQVEEGIRRELIDQILKRWQPEISVRT